MPRFTRPLVKGEDPATGRPVLGFEAKDFFVFDPFQSDCGRFEVDPMECWGISREDANELKRLNQAIVAATEAAINEGCLSLQNALGGDVPGDVAGAVFASESSTAPLAGMLCDYLLQELAMEAAR